ncbi:MAG: T9SS type A sorting domain-containing protein [Bacteroidia bacterium]|nr:T9SS type A sorting domain-containing protein [Bacteroidia bacterium]
MKKFSTICFLIFVSLNVISQNPTAVWGKSFGGNYSESPASIAIDKNENIYTVGVFTDTIDFDTSSGIYNLIPDNGSIYIHKLDSSGNFKWAKSIGSNVGDVVFKLDSLNNFFIVGIAGNCDLDPGPSIFIINSGAFVAKYDSLGNFLWAKEFSYVNNIYSITLDNSGSIIFSGLFYNTIDFDPGSGIYNLTDINSQGSYFTCKLNQLGNFVWANAIQYNGNTSYGYSSLLGVDHFNNIYFSANFGGTVDVDPGIAVNNFTAVGQSDLFITKFNSLGVLVWAKQISCDYPSSAISFFSSKNMAVDYQGNVFITGSFYGGADFDPGVGTYYLNSAGSRDVFIEKLDMNGLFLWAKRIGNTSDDGGYSININNNNNIYITGLFSNNPDFDPGPGTFIMNSTTSYCDVFLTEIDSYGMFLKGFSFGGSTQDIGDCIIANNKGQIYIKGIFRNSVWSTPGLPLTSVGGEDIFIAKIKGFNKSSNVWPGDVNSDGIADNLDVLELGLHYTQTGTPRASISNAWQSYFSNNWSGTITNGKNLNHSDCNGDGIINDDDTLAIFNNYGLTHAFRVSDENMISPQLMIVPDQPILPKGTWGTSSIYLGDASNIINDINGVAFTVNFDNTIIEPNTVWLEYPTSFINTSNQNLHFRKSDFANGKIYTATTHTINNNVSGSGLIGILHYQIKSSLTTDTVLNLGITQAVHSDVSGTIFPLTAGKSSVTILVTSVGLQETMNSNFISMVPNPTDGILTINSKTELQKIEVLSITGQVLLSETPSNVSHTLHLDNFANGIYFVNLYQNNRIIKREKAVLNK